jgi:hypothetical protein
MHGLMLRFAEGVVEGEGRDMIGRFTFSGAYDSEGRVSMIKQYVGRHQVFYAGSYDGEGTIYGQWAIGQTTGPFALTPLRGPGAPDTLSEALVEPL